MRKIFNTKLILKEKKKKAFSTAFEILLKMYFLLGGRVFAEQATWG